MRFFMSGYRQAQFASRIELLVRAPAGADGAGGADEAAAAASQNRWDFTSRETLCVQMSYGVYELRFAVGSALHFWGAHKEHARKK